MPFSTRLVKEMCRLCRSPPEGYSCKLAGDPFEDAVDLTLFPPEGTPFAGGSFKLTLKYPAMYPLVPPSIKFITPIYHPNVDHVGNIRISCLSDKWYPAMSIKEVLFQIKLMVIVPEIQYFLIASIAFEYRFEREKFFKNAEEWTKRYANPINCDEILVKAVERISLFQKEEKEYNRERRPC